MFSQHDTNVRAIITFLKLIKVKVNDLTVRDTLQNHPNWPSLLSIRDSLNKWHIPNGAGKIAPDQFDQLPIPLLTSIFDKTHSFIILTDIDSDFVEYFDRDHVKTKKENRTTFLQKWSGIYLIAEPDEFSGEDEFAKNRKKIAYRSLPSVTLFVSLLAVFCYYIIVSQSSLGFPVIIQDFILVTGVIVTGLLLWYEIDQNNPLLRKACTGIVKGNCSAILTGRASRLLSWLSWSEVGFFYFTGSLLSLLLIPDSIGLLTWLNLSALPYTVFSVYYQWQVAKQWCVLCLCVQALLMLGAVNLLSAGFAVFPFSVGFISLLSFVFPILVWYTVKPYLIRLQESKNIKQEHLRIKYNPLVFNSLLSAQADMASASGLGIDLGNPDAGNTIIKVCNPYCRPCSDMHHKLEILLKETPDLKIKIIFTTPNDPAHDSFDATTHLMAAYMADEKDIQAVLDDWYGADIKDYNAFAAKYPLQSGLKTQNEKLTGMADWCEKMKIEGTPTLFLNGHKLPDAYSIEDIQYFLTE